MKKLLILTFLLIYSVCGYAQIDYPKFATDSAGQKIVLLTIKQAQALDNQTDLLTLFKKMNQQIGAYDSACIQVVNAKNIVIAKQTLQINTLNESLLIKNKQYALQQESINNLQEQIKAYKKESENDKKAIDLHLKEINRSRWQYGAGGGAAGIAVGLIISIIIQR
jgi:hypothetical protein